MNLVKKEIVENKGELEIFVDAKTFKDACEKAYLNDVKRINVPGFRKGKAPRKVVEKLYGSDVFFKSAVNLIYPKAVEQAAKEAEIEIVSLEEIKPIELSEEKGCSFKAICVLKPEATIENYKGIEINAVEKKVDDEAVQNQINILKERCGRLVNVEGRAAKLNDLVLINFEGFVDGKAFEGGKASNYSLKLGSGQFIKGFEEQVVGHKVGDDFGVDVTFPETYHEKKLQGKKANFKCHLNEIKVLQLPKEDDEFAKDVSKFDTLKELKDDIKTNLRNQFKRQFDEKIYSEIANFLAKNVVVKIPEVMINKRADDLANNFENGLARQGFDLNQYLSMTRMSGYDLKDSIKFQAEFQIKVDLALEKIAKLENLEPDAAEYENERKRLAQIYRTNVKEISEVFTDDVLKPQIVVNKAREFLKNNAKISAVLEKPANKVANKVLNKVEKGSAAVNRSAKSKQVKSEKLSSEKKPVKTTRSKRVSKPKASGSVSKSTPKK